MTQLKAYVELYNTWIIAATESAVANQSSKPITVTREGVAAADDLDIKAYACIQYIIQYIILCKN